MGKPEMYRTKDGKRRFQIAAPISEEAFTELRRLARANDTSLAVQIRKAIDSFLFGQAPPPGGFR